jgi:uncharacterized membrane protein YedE/YeeE
MLALKLRGSPSPRQHVRSNTPLGTRLGQYDGNLIGGAILGVGMALTGACPGTMIVQLADSGTYWSFGSVQLTLLGALTGAVLHALFSRQLKRSCDRDVYSDPASAPKPSPSKPTLSDVTGMSEAAVYVAFGTAIAAILRYTPVIADGNAMTTPVVGGLIIGLAQVSSLLLTGGLVGVSTSYEQAARYVLNAFGISGIEKPRWPPRAIVFSAGIFAGALGLSKSGLRTETAASLINRDLLSTAALPSWQAFLGGLAVVFGARTAGGCTSGHGLSGLASLSFSSFLTVAAIFGAGIGTTLLMDRI